MVDGGVAKKQKTEQHQGTAKAAAGAPKAAAQNPSIAAAAGAPKAAAQNPSIPKTTTLGIPETIPFRPAIPEEDEIMSGNAPTLKNWMPKLFRSVVSRLSVLLYDTPEIALRAPLYKQKCPDIRAAAGARDLPTSFKEPWSMANCPNSLTSTGLYEAAGPIWQFDPCCEEWDGQELLQGDASWVQWKACLGHWSEVNFVNSSPVPEQRRFVFPGYIPTAVRSVDVVNATGVKNGFFQDLPVCGGHIMLFSLYGALDDALAAAAGASGEEARKQAVARVLRLYEASLSVTIRMRVAPSASQIVLDSKVIFKLRVLYKVTVWGCLNNLWF